MKNRAISAVAAFAVVSATPLLAQPAPDPSLFKSPFDTRPPIGQESQQAAIEGITNRLIQKVAPKADDSSMSLGKNRPVTTNTEVGKVVLPTYGSVFAPVVVVVTVDGTLKKK
jgi:hypothetical protein